MANEVCVRCVKVPMRSASARGAWRVFEKNIPRQVCAEKMGEGKIRGEFFATFALHVEAKGRVPIATGNVVGARVKIIVERGSCKRRSLVHQVVDADRKTKS